MRKVKFEHLLLCLAVLSFLLASCGGSNSAFIGRWYLVEGSGGSYIPRDIELLTDGTGFALGQAITWKTEKNRFYVTHPDLAMAFNYKLSGSKLELINDDGKKYVYVSKFGGTSALVGAWTFVSVNGEPVTDDYWVEFNRDGTAIDKNDTKFKWFAENDISYEIWGGEEFKYQYQVKGETLTLTALSDRNKGNIFVMNSKRNK